MPQTEKKKKPILECIGGIDGQDLTSIDSLNSS